MFRGVTRVLLVAMLAAFLVPLGLPDTALAHERRTVGGKYQFVVGFLNEPAITDQTNGLDLRVTVPSENNRPVEGLEKTLKATVSVGGAARTMDLTVEPRFGQPGAYVAHFIPTREGSYIFHVGGSIDGVPVDERFESGPGRFDDVQSAQPLQFPEKLPSGLAVAREVEAAREEASLARLLGIGGLLFGMAGLAVGGLALLRHRGSRPRPSAGRVARGSESRAE